MKLVVAIVAHDDANAVVRHLNDEGYICTKLATTGGFLKTGNFTILIGVEEEKLPEVLDIIKEYSHSRRQLIPTSSELGVGFYSAMPVEVTVGGATVFVIDVEQFIKF